MRYFTLFVAVMAAGMGNIHAEEFITAGDGSAFSFESLSAIAGSNVTKSSDGSFEVTDDVTVSKGDSFVLDKGAVIKLGDGVRICLEGKSVMDGGESRTCFTRIGESAPRGIWAESEDGPFAMTNVDMEYVGLSDHSEGGATLTDCTFSLSNGAISSIGAVNCGMSGAKYVISNCKFTECTVPAVGTGANVLTDLLIESCELFDCNSSNSNKPQINVTVGGDQDVVIRGCTITGTGRNKVGGIAVSNLLMAEGTNNVYIENNTISENRYGVTATGPLYIEVRNNTFLNNCHDPNPMAGGSGISLYGANTGQNGIIAGNHIEGHLWGITLIQCGDINCGQVDNEVSPGGNTFKDNGNGGVAYDLYNNGANTVYAQLNTWSVPEQTEEEIETVIFHKNDNAALGEVIFMPAAGTTGVDAVDSESNVAARYLNLNGVEVSNPTRGIYVVRRGDRVSKEFKR